MAFKTYAGLGTTTTLADADLLAAFPSPSGPLKSITALAFAAAIAPKLAPTFLSTANNLSELTASASTARTNLGLGALAPLSTITASLISDPTNVKTTESLIVAVSDEVTPITTGTAKLTLYIPYNFTLIEVFIGNTTPSSSGLVTVNAKQNGTTVFSTQPSIGASQNTSLSGSGSVPAVLSITALTKGDKITVDIAAAGTSATGLKAYFIGHRT